MEIKSLNEIMGLLLEVEQGNSLAKSALMEYALSRGRTGKLELHIQTILSEFIKMFSFEPGRKEGIKHLVKLLEHIRDNYSAHGFSIYKNPAWGALLQLRSPFDFLDERECGACGHIYAHQVIGGFADLATFNCSKCFNLFVGSTFGINQSNTCGKGEGLVFGKCPNCNSENIKSEKSVSPYKYFIEKRFFRKSEECCNEEER